MNCIIYFTMKHHFVFYTVSKKSQKKRQRAILEEKLARRKQVIKGFMDVYRFDKSVLGPLS